MKRLGPYQQRDIPISQTSSGSFEGGGGEDILFLFYSIAIGSTWVGRPTSVSFKQVYVAISNEELHWCQFLRFMFLSLCYLDLSIDLVISF